MRNVYRLNVLTYVFYEANVSEILDDRSDRHCLRLSLVLFSPIQQEEKLIERELCKARNIYAGIVESVLTRYRFEWQ
jgi:hypothetical protein